MNLLLLGDSMEVIAPKHFEVGGTNTFEEDTEVISDSHGEVVAIRERLGTSNYGLCRLSSLSCQKK